MSVFFGFSLAQVSAPPPGGMVIVNIIPGGPLDQANTALLNATGNILLEPQDVITAIDGQATQSFPAMDHIVNTVPQGTTVQVDAVTRFGQPFTVFLTPQAGGTVVYSATRGGGPGGGHAPSGGGQAGGGGGQVGHPGGHTGHP